MFKKVYADIGSYLSTLTHIRKRCDVTLTPERLSADQVILFPTALLGLLSHQTQRIRRWALGHETQDTFRGAIIPVSIWLVCVNLFFSIGALCVTGMVFWAFPPAVWRNLAIVPVIVILLGVSALLVVRRAVLIFAQQSSLYLIIQRIAPDVQPLK